MNKCTSVTGHFDDHGSAPVQYEAHHPMQHDQGFPGSHRTPPSGNYSLRIAQAAARATINSIMMQHVPTLLAVLMAIAMRGYYIACIARWRRFVIFIKTTKRHHWTSARSDITQSDIPTPVVSDISSWKRAPVDMLAPNNNDISNWQEALNNFSRILCWGG